MANVTLEMGPLWKMQLMRDLLEEHGVASFVVDGNMKTIDPMITGAMSFDTRLEVPAESLEAARRALEESLDEGQALQSQLDGTDPEPPRAAEPEGLAELGRRIRWATVLFWMHPFVFVYGVSYLRAVARTRERPIGHGLTMVALVAVASLWLFLALAVLRFGF